MRKRKRQAVKKLIQCAAVIATGVLAKKKAGQGNELQILQPFTPVITGDISKAAGKRDFTYRKF